MAARDIPICGTYPHNNGKVTGLLRGTVMQGRWSDDNGGGRIAFVFSDDFSSFSGMWGNGDEDPDQEWNGTKADDGGGEHAAGVYETAWGALTLTVDDIQPQKRSRPTRKKQATDSEPTADPTPADPAAYRRVLLRSLGYAVAIAVTVLVIFFMQDYRLPASHWIPGDWVVRSECRLRHDAFVPEAKIREERSVPLSANDTVIPIASLSNVWLQVRTSRGDTGFLYLTELIGARQGVISRTTPLMAAMKSPATKDSLRQGDTVTVEEYYIKGSGETRAGKVGLSVEAHYTKVRTADGRKGYVYYGSCALPYADGLPKMKLRFAYPALWSQFQRDVAGRTIAHVQRQYGPATSILRGGDGRRTAYLRHVEAVSGAVKTRGAFLMLDDRGVVTDVAPGDTVRRTLADRLPLAAALKSVAPFRINRSSFYYERESWRSRLEDAFIRFVDRNGVLRVLGWGAYLGIVFGLMCLFLLIPRFAASPFLTMINYTEKFTNSTVRWLNVLVMAAISYAFFLWLSVARPDLAWLAFFPDTVPARFFSDVSGSVLIPAYALIHSLAVWLPIMLANIENNRCGRCHVMDRALFEGTTYEGQSTEHSQGTYDVFKGREERADVIVDHYERRSTHTTSVYDNYANHRLCGRCGYRWTIKWRAFVSSITKYL